MEFQKILTAVIGLSLTAASAAQIRPVNLKVEHLSENIIIDPSSDGRPPRFSWVNELVSKKEVGETQRAYRICVATTESSAERGKGDIWDSGKVNSDDSYLIPYGGRKLAEATDYYWSVKVWNGRGKASEWSTPQRFTVGLRPSSWKAQWIGAPWEGETPQYETGKGIVRNTRGVPYLRKDFSTSSKKIVSAKAFVTGLGYFELYLNGVKVGNDLLVPNFTNYTSRPNVINGGISLAEKSSGFRVSYLKYDITSMLRQGKNAIGAMIAPGYFDARSPRVGAFGSPRFICQVMIKYDDGSEQTVVSDTSWKIHLSGIVFSDLHEGENYDARHEIRDWCSPSYNASSWENAVLRKAPDGELTAFDTYPDRVTSVLHPVSRTVNADGSVTVNFGKLISGRLHIKGLKAKEGDVMKMKFHSNYPETSTYTFRDGEPIDYAPQFTWYVFDKVTFSGAVPADDQVTAEAVNTNMQPASTLQISDSLIAAIQRIWINTENGNIHSGVESDCPHRERLPYTGDGQSVAATVMCNYDAPAFYSSWLRTMRESQNRETGYVPNSAPWTIGAGGGVAWGAAMTLIPWDYYMAYGDERMLRDNYEAARKQTLQMDQWVDSRGIMLQKKCNEKDGQYMSWFNLGDWVPSFELPAPEKIHTYIYWRCSDRMARMAHVLGLKDDEQRFREQADRTAQAYNDVFYANDTTGFGECGPNFFAVEMGLLRKRPLLRDIIYREIAVKHKSHLDVGFIGLEVFFSSLCKAGLNDLAYECIRQTDYPSYGEMIKSGATTMWEKFKNDVSEDHPFLGNGLTWLYRDLAGVNADPDSPAFRHFFVRPVPAKGLNSVSYKMNTPYGEILAGANYHDEGQMQKTDVNVTVPVSCSATVTVPMKSISSIKVNNKDLREEKGVKSVNKTDAGYVVEVGSGSYIFQAEGQM